MPETRRTSRVRSTPQGFQPSVITNSQRTQAIVPQAKMATPSAKKTIAKSPSNIFPTRKSPAKAAAAKNKMAPTKDLQIKRGGTLRRALKKSIAKESKAQTTGLGESPQTGISSAVARKMKTTSKQQEHHRSMAEIRALIKPGDRMCDLEKQEIWRIHSVCAKRIIFGLDHRNPKYTCAVRTRLEDVTHAKLDSMLGHPLPRSHALVFAMVSHNRLGKASVFSGLVPDLLQRIVRMAKTEAALFKIDTSLPPIPINLVFAGDSVVGFDPHVPQSTRKKLKRKLQQALSGWKWETTFAGGFGGITPLRICWLQILALAKSTILAGHRPSEDVKGFPLLQYRQSNDLIDNPATTLKAYALACARGDPHFDMKIKHVWKIRSKNPCISGTRTLLAQEGTAL